MFILDPRYEIWIKTTEIAGLFCLSSFFLHRKLPLSTIRLFQNHLFQPNFGLCQGVFELPLATPKWWWKMVKNLSTGSSSVQQKITPPKKKTKSKYKITLETLRISTHIPIKARICIINHCWKPTGSESKGFLFNKSWCITWWTQPVSTWSW